MSLKSRMIPIDGGQDPESTHVYISFEPRTNEQVGKPERFVGDSDDW
jgi:hypothetical protein